MANWNDAPPTSEELSSLGSSSSDWTKSAPTPQELAAFQTASLPEPTKAGMAESALRGLGQGGTYGFGERAAAGTGAVIQKLLESIGAQDKTNASLGDVYGNLKNIVHIRNQEAKEANPWSYGLGEVGGAINTGLLAGPGGVASKGLGLIGAEAPAAALTALGESGTLGGLTTVGASEGALMGLGNSNSDNITDTAKDVGKGALIGGIAPTALKGVGMAGKGLLKLADVGTDLIPGVGALKNFGSKALTNEGKYFNLGAENAPTGDLFQTTPGKTLEEKAIEHMQSLSEPVKEVQAAGKAADDKFLQTLQEAQNSSSLNARQKALNLANAVETKRGAIGQQLGRLDLNIADAMKESPSYLRQTGDGPVLGKFDFDHLNDQIGEVQNLVDPPIANQLQHVFDKIRSGDYQDVSKQLTNLNDIIGSQDKNIQNLLMPIKQEIEQSVETQLRQLPSDEALKMFMQRKDLGTDYGLLKSLQSGAKTATTGLNLGADAASAPMQTNLSMIANPSTAYGAENKALLSPAYQMGLGQEANEAVQAGSRWQDLVDKPKIGTLGLGPDEEANQAYRQVFGAAKNEEGGISSQTVKPLEDIANPAKTLAGNIKQEDAISWIRNHMFGPGKEKEAEAFIADLQKRGELNQLTEKYLNPSSDYSSTSHGKFRFLKKLANDISYDAGQKIGRFGDLAEQAGVNPTTASRMSATSYRALTQPQNYKNTVEEFKQSQQNNEVVPEK